MATLGHPGVYIREIPSGLVSIEQASTSTAAIIGYARRGPRNTPVFVTRIGDFVSRFGRLNDSSGVHPDLNGRPDHFGHAANAFFLNGGSKAYFVRVSGDGEPAIAALANPSDPGNTALYLTAGSEGAWANGITARLLPVDAGDASLGHTLQLGTMAGDKLEIIEQFTPVSLDPDAPNYVGAALKTGSLLATGDVKEIAGEGAGTTEALRSGPLAGFDGAALDTLVLQVAVDDAAPVDVTFDDTLTTLESVAAFIQAAVRNGAAANTPRAGFAAHVTRDRRLLLVSGGRAATSKVTIPGGTARGPLKFDPGAANEADRPATIEYPGAGSAEFFGGTDGAPTSAAADFAEAFANLKEYRDVSIILLPGFAYDNDGKGVIDAAIAHAEAMSNRMVIVDPPAGLRLRTAKEVKDAGFTTSNFAALYYPWVRVPNPHFDPDTAANLPRTVEVAPSAFAAGLWARIDGKRGVWKAPAGLEADIRGMLGPAVVVGDDVQDNLNEWGVNCIRSIIGPPVIWGARTLATKAKPEDRYVPVRRTALMIGESLYNSLQAVVFEPNSHVLWSSLRAGVGDFMNQLFRAGAFQGEKVSDAYYVRCGLGDTMTQADIDSGIVRVVVGFAPLRPAEFVVVEIKKILRQS
jgi:uncharacterized protein